MDVSFIKKEEPAEFTFVSTYEDQELEPKSNEFQSIDIYTINFKEEPTNDSSDYKNLDHGTTEYETSDYAPESEDTDESFNGSDISEEETVDMVSSKSTSSKSKQKVWQCNTCIRTFRRRCLLITHSKNHRNLADMDLCNICNKYYPKPNREFHLSLHNEPPYICSVCGKEFSCKEKYRCHNKIHREKKYLCDICNKVFISKSLVKSHMEIHQERVKTFQCHICKISFFRKNTLQRHIRNLHSGVPRMKYKCINTPCKREYVRQCDLLKHKCRFEKKPEENQIPIKCPTCDKSFATLAAMKLHCRRYHIQDFKIFFCQKCKKTFRNYDHFVLHSAQNCPDKIMYECDMCSRLVRGKPELLGHFGNYHKIPALRNVPCTLCNKTFSTNTRLTYHMRVHAKLALITKKRTYECKYCSRMFQYNSKCIHHMNKSCTLRNSFDDNFAYSNDLNGQNFQCDICGYTFTQKCAIIDHMLVMHSTISISGASFMKKFTCAMNQRIVRQYPCCDANFIDETVNEKHVVKETCTFPCRKCKKEYANLYSLLRHCAEHTSKVHQSLRHLQQCKACDRLFKWKRSMPEHLQSLEDRLKCLFCEKVFKFKAHYNNHKNKCKLK